MVSASKYNSIRQALESSILSFQPDLNIYWYVPRSIVPPAAIIKPVTHRTIDYSQSQGNSPFAMWHFCVMLIIGQVDEEAAQVMAGDLISPGSPLIAALNNTELRNGYAKVTMGAISEQMFEQGLHTYSELSVTVCS